MITVLWNLTSLVDNSGDFDVTRDGKDLEQRVTKEPNYCIQWDDRKVILCGGSKNFDCLDSEKQNN